MPAHLNRWRFMRLPPPSLPARSRRTASTGGFAVTTTNTRCCVAPCRGSEGRRVWSFRTSVTREKRGQPKRRYLPLVLCQEQGDLPFVLCPRLPERSSLPFVLSPE